MIEVLRGALAGCVATGPMTLAMKVLHRKLPAQERYPLPPRQISMHMADVAGVKDEMDEAERQQFTVVCHFGMGTCAGALYGAVAQNIPLPAVLKGTLFGLGVWAGNYLGLLPALGILRPATEHPRRRTALMIVAHLVWGCSTGLLLGEAKRAAEKD